MTVRKIFAIAFSKSIHEKGFKHMIDINILQNAAEIIQYDSSDIPYTIQTRKLSNFTDMRALCHWHDDIEIIHIFNGEMIYDINGKTLHLRAGDTVIVNSHQMHFGYSHNDNECIFTCMLFHPDLLKSNIFMYQKYVQPIISTSAIEYWYFPAKKSTKNDFPAKFIEDFYNKYQSGNMLDYEVVGKFYLIWNEIYKNSDEKLCINPTAQSPDIHIQKEMITYITSHYYENIELDDIAAAGNISRSKCCQIFKTYMHESPIAYLNAYRMELSCTLLKTTSYSITSIATSCGFNHLSYFSKIFLKKFGCTPMEYRKSNALNHF